jgi:hypothetical protein
MLTPLSILSLDQGKIYRDPLRDRAPRTGRRFRLAAQLRAAKRRLMKIARAIDARPAAPNWGSAAAE